MAGKKKDIDEAFSLVSNANTIPPTNENITVLSDFDDNKEKTSIVVIIASILILITGVAGFYFTLPKILFFFEIFSEISAPYGLGFIPTMILVIFSMIKSVGLIVLSFGLRKMKKWALYILTFLTILSAILIFISYSVLSEIDFIMFGEFFVGLIFVSYFWSISKQFN